MARETARMPWALPGWAQAAADGEEVVGVLHVLLVEEGPVDERGPDVDRAQVAPALNVVRASERPAEGLVRDDVGPGREPEAMTEPPGIAAFRDLPHLCRHRVEGLFPAISTQPGSSFRPFLGLVRFIGAFTR